MKNTTQNKEATTNQLKLWQNSCNESTRLFERDGRVIMPVSEWFIDFVLPEEPDYLIDGETVLNPLVLLSSSEDDQRYVNINDKLNEFLDNHRSPEQASLEIKPLWAGYVLGDLSQDEFGNNSFTLWGGHDSEKPRNALIRAIFDKYCCCPYDEWFAKLEKLLPERWTYIAKRPYSYDNRAGDFVFAIDISDKYDDFITSYCWRHNAKRYRFYTDFGD